MFRSLNVQMPRLLPGFVCLLIWALPALALDPAPVRIHVGVSRCAACHDSAGGRDQFGKWYRSPHARGYAELSLPSSDSIARLSGIDADPFETPICMGCHSTASDTEGWERDESFFLGDGVQCEHCHGPGGDYSVAEVMADPEKARAAGLRFPDQDACMNCHEKKGSHLAELTVTPFEYEAAKKKIDHKGKGAPLPGPSPMERPEPSGPAYAGVTACARCHEGKEMGYTFSKWRLSAHSESYAVLGTEKALAVAKKEGVEGEPKRSAKCLSCHVTGDREKDGFMEGFTGLRGVQCESCHGPGSLYMEAAVMKDPEASACAGLKKITEESCLSCHAQAHGKPFDFESMKARIAHPISPDEGEEKGQPTYKTPFNLALTNDGKRLFAVCEGADSVIVVDTEKRAVLNEIEVGNLPNGICVSEDERLIYVSNRGEDTVSVIDWRKGKILATIGVGDEPHDLSILDGRLYVANAGSNDISVIDLEKGIEEKRLSGGRGTWAMDVAPDKSALYVTNNLSHFVPFREPSRSEVTVIGARDGIVENRIMIPEANLVQGIDFSPDGEFALVTLLRTKNLVPIVRVMQGWMITNGIGILWKDGRVDQLLIDGFDDYFADPTDVVITPDGRFAYVSGGGVDQVAVIDLLAMKTLLSKADEEERRNVLPNHLGITGTYVRKRIGVGRGPRGLAASRDGRFVYVADALDDAISIIDTQNQKKVGVVDLGGPSEITLVREGERIFHSANVTYGRQFSCHSCHPDGGIDGLAYDIEPDGLGLNPVDNRTLRGVLDTAPFKWTGKNVSLSRQCGPRLAVFFTRIDPFTPEEVIALEQYICTIPRNPNRYRRSDTLSPAQRRGRVMFKRTRTNTGEIIPVKDRCDTCHSGPYFTNRKKMDVGTASSVDTQGVFDVPHLNNIYETAPYLHDGQSETLEEIWTRFNPEDKHGVTNDMTKDQLNDLIEYLKTL